MALATGETVSYETRDGKMYVYRALGGVKVDLSTSGEASLADAKTNATTGVGNHKTAVGVTKTLYGGRITALAGAATRTHAGTDINGSAITINEYDISEGGVTYTFYVPSTKVAAEDARYNVFVANIDLDRAHDDDLVTAIATLV